MINIMMPISSELDICLELACMQCMHSTGTCICAKHILDYVYHGPMSMVGFEYLHYMHVICVCGS